MKKKFQSFFIISYTEMIKRLNFPINSPKLIEKLICFFPVFVLYIHKTRNFFVLFFDTQSPLCTNLSSTIYHKIVIFKTLF